MLFYQLVENDFEGEKLTVGFLEWTKAHFEVFFWVEF
jgi:hypothetical protein